MAIYVTSDLHIGHNKEFLFGPRGFEDVYSHDQAIIKNFNEIVTDEDDLYILGDIMLGDNNYGRSIFNQLPGRKHIIIGNHDTDARIDEIYSTLRGVVEITFGARLRYGKYSFLLTHYPTLTSNFDIEKPLKTRVINLAGHVHTKDKFADFDKGLIYHVELDAHDMKPVEISKILDDIKKKIGEKNG